MGEVVGSKKSFLTTGEVARVLGCSSFWITRLIATGVLESHRLGDKSWHRVPVSTVERYARDRNLSLDWSLLQQQ